MYNDLYPKQTSATIEISLVQILMIGVIIWGALIFPVQLITYQRAQNEPDTVYTAPALQEREKERLGNVAGASTSNATTIQIPFTDYNVTLDSDIGIMLVTGTSLLALAVLVILYLIISGNKRRSSEVELELLEVDEPGITD